MTAALGCQRRIFSSCFIRAYWSSSKKHAVFSAPSNRPTGCCRSFFPHRLTAGPPQLRRFELVERATSLSGSGNANRAPTLPYDLVYIDNAVLAAVQLSQAVGSIPISLVQRPSLAISWRRTFDIPLPSTTSSSPLVYHPLAGSHSRIDAAGTARDPRRRVGHHALVQHSPHAAPLRESRAVLSSVSARRSSRSQLNVSVNNVRI
jgi:hypothetical protein